MFKGNRKYMAALLPLVMVGVYLVLRPAAFAASYYGANTYTSWWFPSTTEGYNSLSVDFKPEHEATASNGVFWAHQFGFKGGDGGYVGLQNAGSVPTGKIAIFSIWQSMSVTGPQFAEKVGGEGSNVHSARIVYNWRVGRTYTLTLKFDRTDSDGDWWKATVRDKTTNVTKEIGQIEVPKAWAKIRNTTSTWTESYLPLTSCSQLQFTGVIISVPKVNNSIKALSHNNSIQQSHGGGGILCSQGSYSVDFQGGVRQWMGAPSPPPSGQPDPTPNPNPNPNPSPNPSPSPPSNNPSPSPSPSPSTPSSPSPNNPSNNNSNQNQNDDTIPVPSAKLVDADNNEILPEFEGDFVTYDEGELITMSGTTVPNGRITLYISSDQEPVEVEADQDGNWTHTILAGLESGLYVVEAEVADPETNNVSERGEVLSFQVALVERVSEIPIFTPGTGTGDPEPTEGVNGGMLVLSGLLIAAGIGSGLWLWPRTRQ